ncbi:MAG: hypothetical protein WCB11_01550 [Terriglobales bacterium]
MLSDYAAMTFAAMVIAVASFGMTALAVQFVQWLLEIGQFMQRVPMKRAKNLAVDKATTLTLARELATK